LEVPIEKESDHSTNEAERRGPRMSVMEWLKRKKIERALRKRLRMLMEMPGASQKT
jgi:hypothetical protein